MSAPSRGSAHALPSRVCPKGQCGARCEAGQAHHERMAVGEVSIVEVDVLVGEHHAARKGGDTKQPARRGLLSTRVIGSITG